MDMDSSGDRKQTLRQELLQLNQQRGKFEDEIKTYQQVLASQGVGMNEPLVDNEGFPRNDLDLWQVRTARNKIITLQNDCKDLMKQIETKLHEFHALGSGESCPPSR